MNVVDSSGWIEFLTDGANADFFQDPLGDTATLLVPSVCLLEVFKWVLRRRGEAAALEIAAAMMQGEVVDLDADTALLAAQLGLQHGLPLADSVVYATARARSADVWTQDGDFEGLPGVRFVPVGG